MARTSFTNPSRARRQPAARSNAELLQVTVIVEIHEIHREQQIEESKSSSSNGTSSDENRSSSSKGTSSNENKSSSSKGTSSDAEEMVQGEKQGKSKGMRPLIPKTESKRMRNVKDTYSAKESVKGNIMGKGNKSDIDTTPRPKRARCRTRGGKTISRVVRSSYSKRSVRIANAGQRGKGKKQEDTDGYSEPELEEVCKGFKGRNNDDDSDNNDGTGGGGGEAHETLSSLVAELVA